MTVGGSTTPADMTCTWKAAQASEFPPSESVSGWRGGWKSGNQASAASLAAPPAATTTTLNP